VNTCPCGQTFGTCRRHPGAPPEYATITFAFKGEEIWTYVRRGHGMNDATWQEAIEYCLNSVADKLDNSEVANGNA
jgi:hypothetical protein